MASGDAARVAATLPAAWARMQEIELEVPFATLYAKALMDLPLTGEAAAIAYRVGLLSPQAETWARRASPETPEDAFLTAIALGRARPRAPRCTR